MTTQEYFERIKGAEREYAVAWHALQFCVLAHKSQTSALQRRIRTQLEDAERCLKNLESTYIIRMYSIFEAALRDYWRYHLGRKTSPDMKPLIDSIAAYIRSDLKSIMNVHQVRQYRNDLVHNLKAAKLLTIQECRNRLSAFLSYFEKGPWKLKFHP